MMTHHEPAAGQEAAPERLHTFKLAGQPTYIVKSRKLEPGSVHLVHVNYAGEVTHCDCPGWYYRQSCAHAQAVTRRLERERRRGRRTAVQAA
jgi:hypothetical protein